MWYLFHDGTIPFSLVFRLILERSVGQPRYLSGSESVGAAMRQIVRPFIVSPFSPMAAASSDLDYFEPIAGPSTGPRGLKRKAASSSTEVCLSVAK